MYKHYLDTGIMEDSITKYDAIKIIKDKKLNSMINKAVGLIKHIDNFIKFHNVPIVDTKKDEILYADSLIFYLNKDNLNKIIDSLSGIGFGFLFDKDLKEQFDNDFLHQNATLFVDTMQRTLDLYNIIKVLETADKSTDLIKERL